MSQLDISQFKIDQAVMQITYPNAYFLWDNSGKIWEKIKVKYPKMKIVDNPSPDKVSCSLNKNSSVSVSINNFVVNSISSSNLDQFNEDCLFIYKICLEELKFNLIERIGLRIIFTKEYSSLDEISKLFLNLNLINFPSKKLFNIEGKMSSADLKFKWDDDSSGCVIRLAVEKRKILFDPPAGWGIEDISKEKNIVIYDVDYYKNGNINISQLDLSTWLSLATRQIKKENETFFKLK